MTLRLLSALFLASLLPSALAGERLFVSNFDNEDVEVYDEQGARLGSVAALSGGVIEMDRSRGGSWIYVQHYYGEMSTTHVGSLVTLVSPDLSPVGSWDLAPHPNRSEVYVTHNTADLIVQDAAANGITGILSLTGDLAEIAVTRAGDRIYAADGDSGDLIEYDPATDTWQAVAYLGFDVVELGVSRDDTYVVAAGLDTFHAMELGDPDEPTHIAVYDRLTGTLSTVDIDHGEYASGLEFSAIDSVFWVSTALNVQPLHYSRSTGATTLSATTLGGPGVRDIASSNAYDLYVLYDDRLDRYDTLWNLENVVTFPSSEWRFHLAVVPEPTAKLGLTRVAFYALFGELKVRGQLRRWPWPLQEAWLKCADCAAADMEREQARAEEYLDGLKGEDPLSISDVERFMAGAEGSDLELAMAVLDDLLIAPPEK